MPENLASPSFLQTWLEIFQANGVLIGKMALQVGILIGLIYFIYNRFILQSHA